MPIILYKFRKKPLAEFVMVIVICAEGLLVFGIGGAAFIYAVAPWADNMIVKIRSNVVWPVCIVLIAVFITDVVYSSIVPNTGKGITSSPDEEAEKTGRSTEIQKQMLM